MKTPYYRASAPSVGIRSSMAPIDAFVTKTTAERVTNHYGIPREEAGEGKSTPATGFRKLLLALMETSGIWFQRSRSRAHLTKLDDYMLLDIGITRNQAYQESQKWFWRA